ncbi:MAG TPA: Ig-like domain-containing protein, partial [Burkholderiales bacterium]|nr:Ig-like domain-containing protein [Burkholderiales bacterium]
MNWGRRLAYILSLAATIILASIAPRSALAQLGIGGGGGSLVVSITAPSNGANVTGTIPVTASVTSLGGLTVQSVQFKLDGANLGAADTSPPYSVNWDTRTASNASHTLTAVATDFFGVQWTSNPVTVTVFNDTTPPSVSITSPADGSTVSGTVTLAANATDNVGVVGVQFQIDGNNFGPEATAAPYSAQWNTLNATN